MICRWQEVFKKVFDVKKNFVDALGVFRMGFEQRLKNTLPL
jgi:hypothetical protein